MDFSRRHFLKLAAAGLPVAVAAPLLLRDTAQAESSPPPKVQGPGRDVKVLEIKRQYNQETAAGIHMRSVEREIREAGEIPEKVRERVDRRIRELKVGAMR
jgi:hypothetical protein